MPCPYIFVRERGTQRVLGQASLPHSIIPLFHGVGEGCCAFPPLPRAGEGDTGGEGKISVPSPPAHLPQQVYSRYAHTRLATDA